MEKAFFPTQLTPHLLLCLWFPCGAGSSGDGKQGLIQGGAKRVRGGGGGAPPFGDSSFRVTEKNAATFSAILALEGPILLLGPPFYTSLVQPLVR